MARLLVCSLLLSCLLAGTTAADTDVKFPELKDIFRFFFQTEVVLTDLLQQDSAFVKEFFDNSQDRGRGRVEVMAFGNKQSVFYYNSTDEILEVNSTHCLAWQTDESEYSYYEMFYGWLHKDPLIVGPSALLWYAQDNRDSITYDNQEDIRDIKCDKFTLKVINDRDDFDITYYFAVDTWTTPYQLKIGDKALRVPIRIDVDGISSRESSEANASVPVSQIIDYIYFRPTIKDWLGFQPPIGLGCPLRKPTLDMPKIPRIYKLSAEVYDEVYKNSQEDFDINFDQLWYDSIHKIARLDTFTKLGYTSRLFDFSTGVKYIQKDGETCKIEALQNSFFEGYNDDGVGYLKKPAEVLGLVGDFYYMGESSIRGIRADIFENVHQDLKYEDVELDKLVTTVYFTKEFMQVAVDGETLSQVPIYIRQTGYETPTKIAFSLNYNIFAFSDVVWPAMHTTFDLSRCFPDSKQKSYFLLIFNATKELSAKMEAQNDILIALLKNQIMEHTNISEIRLPFLKADFKQNGVYVTGLMLDRPPAIKQFWLLNEGETEAYEFPKAVPDATTEEECAFACVGETTFSCTGLYFCNNDCFIKRKGILKPNKDGDKVNMGKCKVYIRAERDSNNTDLYLADALKYLEDAVLRQDLKVGITVEDGGQTVVPVQDIVIGEGPYTGDNSQDKPFELLLNGFQIKNVDETTQALDYADTLNDCYRGCKNSESLACSSFSYCPTGQNKACRISSVFMSQITDSKNYKDVEPNANCNLYSLKYLDFYEALSGKVVVVPGQKSIKNVATTEECAKNCRTDKEVSCRGFEYCRSARTCVLHSKHVLDLQGNEVMDSKQAKCVHYSAKFSADYLDMGYTLIDDDSNKRIEITLEECAKACSEEMMSCKSFNFCPPSEQFMTDSSCSLTTLTLLDKGVKTTIKGKCHHYTKKSNVEDWGASKFTKFVDESGYTAKTFGGLVIGMLVLGLIIGVLGFVAYSYFRSKSSDEGMTVRFMKQADT